MNETNATVKEAAQRVVSRLLGEDHASADDYHRRPGGKADPFRQTTGSLNLKNKDFTGKRSVALATEAKPEAEDEEDEENEARPKVNPRFKFRQSESRSGSVPKAFKKGKRTSGKAVAGKPGGVSYRESLISSVLARIEEKKRAKGQVAKTPGKVQHGKK